MRIGLYYSAGIPCVIFQTHQHENAIHLMSPLTFTFRLQEIGFLETCISEENILLCTPLHLFDSYCTLVTSSFVDFTDTDTKTHLSKKHY